MDNYLPTGSTLRGCAVLLGLTLAATATVQVQTTSPADAATSLSTRRTQLDSLTDQVRKKAGCKPLHISDRLNTSAQGHAEDMAAKRYLSHTSADGTTWIQRIKAAGYPDPGAENVARGRTSAGEALKLWMASPGHGRNITNCALTRVGIGYANPGNYWVQDFGY